MSNKNPKPSTGQRQATVNTETAAPSANDDVARPDDASTSGLQAEAEAEKTPVGDLAASEISATAAQEASRASEPLKETRQPDRHELIQERADPSIGRSGEPTSAELRREPLPAHDAAVPERRAAGDVAYAGTLPASERVLPNGRSVRLSAEVADTEEREFTAAIRTMRNRKLYEIGAPIPLTRTEFESKSRNGAIVEKLFALGRMLTAD